MDLLFVRHGLAWERDAERWADDRDRPLRPLGIRRMRAAARGLARVLPPPDALWTSPFVRAARTAAILREEASWPEPRALAALGEDAPPGPVLAAAARTRSLASLAVVGHAPQLDLVVTLAVTGRRRPAIVRLKKGGVACVRFEQAVRPGAGVLIWVATPHWLRALDE